MRIPWSVPTVSDATKLGLCAKWDLPDANTLGGRIYRLLEQALYSTDWADATDWSEVDSGGLVNLADGVWTMNGSNSWTTNGIYKTTGVTRAVGFMEVKFQCASTTMNAHMGFHLSAGIGAGYLLQLGVYLIQPFWQKGAAGVGFTGKLLTVDTWYTARIYVLQDTGGQWNRGRITLQGGTEYPAEEVIVDTVLGSGEAWAATLYPMINRYHSNAALHSFKEFRWYSGFATTGPTLTYVADAGAGQLFQGFDPTNLAAIGSWVATNCTFAYSFDDGAASYSAEKTLAQLNAEAALTTNKRYIRLRVTVNSDGATQQYAGELNADDGTAGVWVLPTASTIVTGTTINTIAGSATAEAHNANDVLTTAGGNATLPAAAKVMADAGDYGNPTAPVTPILPLAKVATANGGTRTDAAAANVKTGSGAYGGGGTEFTPSYSPDFPAATSVAADDTVDGVAGSIAPANILTPRGTAVTGLTAAQSAKLDNIHEALALDIGAVVTETPTTKAVGTKTWARGGDGVTSATLERTA